MNLQLEILIGQPSDEELVALSSARVQLEYSIHPEPPITDSTAMSAWQLSGKLQTTALVGWPLKGSAWERSERLAQPWQS
jgi:hypothetical protein